MKFECVMVSETVVTEIESSLYTQPSQWLPHAAQSGAGSVAAFRWVKVRDAP